MFECFYHFKLNLINSRWYLKAQQLNPKNGRPYNQLALLAHYAVSKAVRNLISKEQKRYYTYLNMNSLFSDENWMQYTII